MNRVDSDSKVLNSFHCSLAFELLFCNIAFLHFLKCKLDYVITFSVDSLCFLPKIKFKFSLKEMTLDGFEVYTETIK